MFEGFKLEMISLPASTLRVRHGGSGPPVLLLHGHPRTHATWHQVAPLLAQTHTVVCPDIRGFGFSSKPADTPDHSGSSKRAKAGDCVALMKDYRAGLGIDRKHDAADRMAGRKIACPTLVLWSLLDDLESLHGDILDVWRAWAPDLRGRGLHCGHHMAEESPVQLGQELLQFLAH